MIKTDNLIKIGLNIYAIYTSGVIFSRNWVIVFTKRKDKAAADTIIWAISASLKEEDIAAPHVFKGKIGRKKDGGRSPSFLRFIFQRGIAIRANSVRCLRAVRADVRTAVGTDHRIFAVRTAIFTSHHVFPPFCSMRTICAFIQKAAKIKIQAKNKKFFL